MLNKWKPIRVLKDNSPGYICYDEEFKIVFKLYPDDNHEHWNTYLVYPLTPEQALLQLGDKAQGLEIILPGALPNGYFEKFDCPEVRGRIIDYIYY